jgi:hypothetical protein
MTTFDALEALSLARTALDDPDGLPSFVELRSSESFVAFAIDRIDEAMGALLFDEGGCNDAAGEARWVAKNLAGLVGSFHCSMATERRWAATEDKRWQAFATAHDQGVIAARALMEAVSALEALV